MLEIKSERNSDARLGPDISFEMPAHEMCVERQAVLFRFDGQSEYVTFGIDFMPDKIHVGGRKFVYEGVADGRGFYREKPKDNRERQSELSPRPGSQAESIEFETNYSFPDDKLHEPEIYDTHGSLGSMSAALRYAEDLALGAENESMPRENSLNVLGIDTDCACCMAQAVLPAGTLISGRHTCLVCYGTGQVLPRLRPVDTNCSPDDGCGLQADSHTTASPCDNMQCPRCSEVLETVRQMVENPPGLSGIIVNKERYGNKYIDWGWVEACNRVIRLLVQGGSGTREAL